MNSFPLTLNGSNYNFSDFEGRGYTVAYPDLLADFTASMTERFVGTVDTLPFIPRLRNCTFTGPSNRLWSAGDRLLFTRIVTDNDPAISYFIFFLVEYNATSGTMIGFIDNISMSEKGIKSGIKWRVEPAPKQVVELSTYYNVASGGFQSGAISSGLVTSSFLIRDLFLGSPYQSIKEFFEDFDRNVDFTSGKAYPWVYAGSSTGKVDNGKGAATPTGTRANTSGVARFYTSAVNDYAYLFAGETTNFAGAVDFSAYIYIPQLGNGSHRVTFQIGFSDGTLTSSAFANRGIGFEYDPATSVNWRTVIMPAGVVTKTSSAVAVTTGWHLLRFTDSPGHAGEIEFYVDGVSLGHFTGKPATSSASTLLGPVIRIKRTLGSSAERSIFVDMVRSLSQASGR